ncbi:hypothetical protein TraAM80_01592 [Trypanosoma rangeli]|uniref:CWF21 domain-containing protein n=1 Tax=Trypanosoma rangeli TaxID=5698 RepID=A0A3R7MZG4_TRYRA|nr:uncharacterized protein TraAM80_01592 [Trypanosoma rangeli]RNF10419.1 hypothetical protein TraAM80_01592 [Trypanosoma rangeli]|eukprot:RNF10419.1 hypothetical protein TraAM80_01592 [Trypanosoma rangeli]
MYNGLEAISVKGTGLSGYVQRSKAAVSQLAKFTPAEYTDDIPPATINPLEALRSAKENRDLAARLRRHEALRGIKLKVFMYREERVASGVAADVVERECQTLYDSLMRNYRDEAGDAQRVEAAEAAQKTAERFAAAFRVRPGAVGDAFDRVQREAERRAAEEEHRNAMEQKIAQRVKRIKGEMERGGH